LECYIFSKLIIIALGWRILWGVAQHLYRIERKAMSFYKAFKTFINVKLVEIRDVFLHNKGSLFNFMVGFYASSRKNHLLERKKGKPLSLELLVGFLTI
jgi:hypothetical protein